MPKKYAFSVAKHGHDIQFRMDTIFCEMHDMEVGTLPWDERRYERIKRLRERLVYLTSFFDGPVAHLPAPQYALAKETVFWAAETRAERNAAKR